jgi:NAD(P)-dependent dehydrogenase (short-subunit alcohol dehydrogenase family)
VNLKEAVCIVTGSATGVGSAVVKRLAAKGARVVINFTRSRKEAEETRAACEALGAEALLVQADISSDADCRRMAAETLARWGRIDALVNNAAVTKAANPHDLESLSGEDFLRVFGVNVVGTYQMVRAVVPAMRKAGGGAVVNVSSNVAVTGGGSSIAYTASKGALNSMTLALARVLGPEIRVNAVCPGIIDTRWMPAAVGAEAFDALVKRFEQSAPMARVAQPDDIAEPIVWLLEGAGYVTGELLMVDGGIRLSGGAPRKKA